MISEVYNEDCMIGMARYPDKYFDLAVVDPPYGIKAGNVYSENEKRLRKGSKAMRSEFKIKWDDFAPETDYFDLLNRKSKNLIVWGANHFMDNMPFKVSSSCWIIWDKKTGENGFADAEIAWTNYKSAIRIFSYQWSGMLQGDMKNKEIRIHPTQKPVKLYDWIYKNYLPQGGKVIDTHLGSGSNRIAADKAGNIDFYGWELDTDYFNAQEKRWSDFKKQLIMAF